MFDTTIPNVTLQCYINKQENCIPSEFRFTNQKKLNSLASNHKINEQQNVSLYHPLNKYTASSV